MYLDNSLNFDYTKYSIGKSQGDRKYHKDTFIYSLSDFLNTLGVKVTTSLSIARCLYERMSDLDLYYHNFIHPLALFSFAEQNNIKLNESEILAVWFHDAIYVPGARMGNNEQLSADFLGCMLEPILGSTRIDLAQKIIRQTSNFLNQEVQNYSKLVMDLDLSSFAFDYNKFVRVQELVAKELGGSKQDAIKFYNMLMTGRSSIFRTATFSKFEDQAHININRFIKENSHAD